MLELHGRYILSIDRSHVGSNMRTLPSGGVFGAGIVSLQHLREWELQQYERISVYSVCKRDILAFVGCVFLCQLLFWNDIARRQRKCQRLPQRQLLSSCDHRSRIVEAPFYFRYYRHTAA